MSVTLSYIYQCSRCENKKMDMIIVDMKYGPIAKPCIPDGWFEIGSSLYCQNHIVEVKITDLKKEAEALR